MAAKKQTTKAKAIAAAPKTVAEIDQGIVSAIQDVKPKLNAAGWRDPKSVYADDDTSIDARMWRLNRDRS